MDKREFINNNFLRNYHSFSFFAEYNDHFWGDAHLKYEDYYFGKEELQDYMNRRKDILDKCEKTLKRGKVICIIVTIISALLSLLLLWLLQEGINWLTDQIEHSVVANIIVFVLGIFVLVIYTLMPVFFFGLLFVVYELSSLWFEKLVQLYYNGKFNHDAYIEQFLSDSLWIIHKNKIEYSYEIEIQRKGI